MASTSGFSFSGRSIDPRPPAADDAGALKLFEALVDGRNRKPDRGADLGISVAPVLLHEFEDFPVDGIHSRKSYSAAVALQQG